MHFVALVPLSLAITFVVVMAILKAIAIVVIAVIALIAWIIYVAFFKKDEPEIQEKDEYDLEIEYWDRELRKQQREDAEFYRRMGRLEQQLDDTEKRVGIKRKRNKK
jgi:hypothetical protein